MSASLFYSGLGYINESWCWMLIDGRHYIQFELKKPNQIDVIVIDRGVLKSHNEQWNRPHTVFNTFQIPT